MKSKAKKIIRNSVLLSLSLSVLSASFISNLFIQNVSASVALTNNTEQEWNELSGILSNTYGEWNTPSYSGAISSQMPDTAILGNGDVGVTSYGDSKTKQFLVSKGDFWSAGTMNSDNSTKIITLGGIKIREKTPDHGLDLALGKPVTESSHHDDFVSSRVTDGIVGTSDASSWVSSPGSPQWISVDFGEIISFSRYVIQHGGAARSDRQDWNTKSFKVQVTSDAVITGATVWTDIDAITNNSAAITDKLLAAPVQARQMRVYITEGTQTGGDGRSRLAEVEVYNPTVDSVWDDPQKSSLALNAAATASSTHDSFSPSLSVNGASQTNQDADHENMWTSAVGNSQWISYDLGSVKTFDRWVVRHGGFARMDKPEWNMQDFKLQISSDGVTWTDVESIVGNTESITDRILVNPVSSRYVRLLITKATQATTTDSANNPRARIAQFELYHNSNFSSILSPVSFNEIQDIQHAEIRTQMPLVGQSMKMQTWVSATDNTFITEIVSTGNKAVNLEVVTWAKNDNALYPADAGNDASSAWASRKTDNQAKSNPKSWTSEAVLLTKLIGASSYVASSNQEQAEGVLKFTLQPNQPVQIVTSVGGGGQTYDNMDVLKQAKSPLHQAKDQLGQYNSAGDIAALHDRHLDWWKSYWLKSYINLDNTDANLSKIERYYYGSQYILGSTVREGKLAPGLYGIWRTTDDPLWSGDYHLNYNFFGPVYGSYSSNRPDQGLPMVDALWDFMPEGERRAREEMTLIANHAPPEAWQYIQNRGLASGIDGALLYPVSIGPWGSAPEGPSYIGQTIDAAYGATQFISYYRYTQNEQFLKEKLVPYLEKVAKFYESWLEKEDDGQGGYRYIAYDGYHEYTFAKNSGVTSGLAWNVFNMLTEAVAVLGENQLGVSQQRADLWKDIRDHMAETPTMQRNGQTVYALADNGDFWPNSGNVELEFIHPGERLGFNSDPQKLQIARNTLTQKAHTFGQINNTPKAYTQAARVGYPAQSIIDYFLQQTYPAIAQNFRIPDNNHGIEKAGATEAFNNLLLQSDNYVIKVFPDWVQNKDAKFVRLREKGAFLVSSEYKGATQEVQYVDITSEKGKDLSVMNPWPGKEVEVYEDGVRIEATKSTNHSGEIYTVPTKANSSYVLKQTGGVRQVTLESITPSTAVTDIKMGTAKTAAALGLPSTVEIVTNQTQAQAVVVWDLTNASYDPTLKNHQTFTVGGSVTLPNGIENPNGVSLLTSIKVTVNKVPQSQMTATATSEESGKDVASNAIDGDPQTIWHTKWNQSDVLPQSITLNLGGTYNKINKVTVLPRPEGGNGNITGYNMYASTDGTTFTKVATGSWANDAAEKTVTFTPTDASYVKVEVTSGNGGWATAAEINVFASPIVEDIPIKVQLITISSASASIGAKGGTLQLDAAVLPANATNKSVTWAVYENDGTTATDKATIGATGRLTAVKDGVVKVVATAADGSGVHGVKGITLSGQTDIIDPGTDPVKVASINITSASTVIAVKGGSLSLSAAVLPINATNTSVTWAVYEANGAATDKAIIDQTGLLKAVKDGNVKVVAAATDGSGVRGEIMITISGQNSTSNPGTGSSSSSGNPTTPPVKEDPTKYVPKDTELRIEPVQESQTAITAIINRERLSQKLADLKAAGSSILNFEIPGEYGKNAAELPLDILYNRMKENKETVLTLSSHLGSYNLPLSILNREDVASLANAEGATLIIRMDEAKSQQEQQFDQSIAKEGMKRVSDMIDYKVILKAKDQEVEIANFGNRFITRVMNVDGAIQDASIATAVVYDPATGELKFVPSVFTVKNGKTEATITRNTNSLYAIVQNKKTFADMNGHWAQKDVETLASKMVIDGTTDLTYTPEMQVTRAQFAALLVRGLGLQAESTPSVFTDVAATQWYASEVGTAAKYGLVQGVGEGRFNPDQLITREQMVVMMMKAVQLVQGESQQEAAANTRFADRDQLSDYARSAVAEAFSKGLVHGKTATTFAPQDAATRAEAAVLIKQAMQYLKLIN
ncbi:hypothetical protein GCM10008018_13020 [Paenibacillus marchantiophytorum]|uniref:Uncharacterized protein n=1 Tax=Paenibacillus marchantiophytorum TaxID=1619310 RepID=A0ABQ2BTW3_9BACL|nr:discoidin domain-containing protein [Paenibacillus marchantiophytorum]GGI45610.1 hypothetical protein GCM10008018_13020 [Paenibacillus marchantiophytorum]